MPIPHAVMMAGLLASMPAVRAHEMSELAHEMQGGFAPWHVGGNMNGRLFGQPWGDYEYFDGFFAMRSVKSTYIALFCLWLIWIITRMLNSLFGKSARTTRDTAADANAAPATAAGTTAGTTAGAAEGQPATAGTADSTRTGAHTGRAGATTRMEKLVRDLLLLLLVPLMVNGFGRGSGVGVEILTWIFFAFAVIFALVEFIAGNRLFRSGFNLLLIALSLVVFILAFSSGWNIP